MYPKPFIIALRTTRPGYEIIKHLFNIYEEITPKTFQECRTRVKAVIIPMGNLIKEINNTVDLSGQANVRMAQTKASA